MKQEDLEAALSIDDDFDGSFFSSVTYGPDEARNPTLRLENVGNIGSPLSEMEAKRIVPYCEREDDTENSPWVMDAAAVSLR